MADSNDVIDHLSDAHWQKVDQCPNKEDYKEIRLTRHIDKGSGTFMFLAQSCGDDGDIFQLTMNDTKSDPFQGVQIVTLAIKDRQEIIGVGCVDNKYFVRK